MDIKKLIVLLFIAGIGNIVLTPHTTEAAKKFTLKKTATRKSTSVGSPSIPAIVKYKPDHQGILLSFSRFDGLESVSYSFTYDTNGVPQGVGGTINTANNPAATRELLFGTCSSSVCRYHYNLNNARLSLKAQFTNGKTSIKNYRIKTYQ